MPNDDDALLYHHLRLNLYLSERRRYLAIKQHDAIRSAEFNGLLNNINCIFIRSHRYAAVPYDIIAQYGDSKPASRIVVLAVLKDLNSELCESCDLAKST